MVVCTVERNPLDREVNVRLVLGHDQGFMGCETGGTTYHPRLLLDRPRC